MSMAMTTSTETVFDKATICWTSRTEVAEVPFNAFADQKKTDQIPGDSLFARRTPSDNSAIRSSVDTERPHDPSVEIPAQARPTASPRPASRTGKAHWFLSDPTASSRHCCQARWCWIHRDCIPPPPTYAQVSVRASPASTVV
jgi:hypothetical protein